MVFGTSSGGGLTLAMVLQAKAEGLPPATIAPGTPWVDLTASGDSIQANAYVDNVLVANTGWAVAARGVLCRRAPSAGPADLTDLWQFQRLPAGDPHLRDAREGMSHAQYLHLFLPETEEAFAEITGFLKRHLAA